MNTSASNDREKIRDRLEPVIGAVAERIHYAEQRRSSFSAIGGAFIAGGIALLTFASTRIDPLTIEFAVFTAGASLSLVGAVILIAYSRQTNRYPWTSATKTWKWFYRDALPREMEFNPKWWSYFRFGPDKERIKKVYANQLAPFKQSIERLADDDTNFAQDVEQLYVLHVNEKYKNLHLSDLRKITERGILIGILAVVLSALLGSYLDRARAAPHDLSLETGVLRIAGEWRHTDCSDSNSCERLLVTVVIRNPSPNTVPLPVFSGIDSAGLAVPLRIEESSFKSSNVPAESSFKVVLVLSPLALVKAPIRSLVVLNQ